MTRFRSEGAARTYPKSRLDALTDGVFAVAMTLLVLDIRLPARSELLDSAGLVAALHGLWSDFLAYAVSFFVLGVRWRSSLDFRTAQDALPLSYVRWWLVYLFFVTCVPFTTSVVGHHGRLAPAAWLYAANLILMALAILPLTPHLSAPDRAAFTQRMRQYLLIASAVVSIAISFVAPVWAMLAYLLNIFAEPLAAWPARLRDPDTSPSGATGAAPRSGD